VFRPFFIAGILSVLTAGCALGAIALFGIAQQGSYTASAWTPYVLAHANSQLYGWVGFFVIGFSLQHHAPNRHQERLFRALAVWTLGLMAAGIGLRFVAEPMVQVERELWTPVGVFSGVLQLAAVMLFNVNIALTRQRTGGSLPWQSAFIFTSLLWWLVVATLEPFYFARSHAPDGIMFVAEFFPPYREAQFLGFVAMMIFGVALAKMHEGFGTGEPNRRLGMLGYLVWNAGLLARMGGWIYTFRHGMAPGSGWIYIGGGFLLCLGALLLASSSRIFEKLAFHVSSHKFIRASFAWLLVAGVLMLLEPVHLSLIGQPFSHAYIGAIRHAATVGFISQMILGIGLRVAYRMSEANDDVTPELWTAFVLLNAGNAGRVALEIATDYTPSAFAPMGATGFIELVGLAIWGTTMLGTLIRSRRLAYAG
jgi:hypothetical protein